MHSHTVSWLRRKASTDVAGLRRELIALETRDLLPEVKMQARHRLESAIIAVYDEARRVGRKETAVAREVATAHRPKARRAAGAAGDPVRADATAKVAPGWAPAAPSSATVPAIGQRTDSMQMSARPGQNET